MIRLHDYWRSGAAYRVRIALNLKGIPYEAVSHDLRTGAQREASYVGLNPQGLIPALETGEITLTQSLAIIEWIEERKPEPPLLPPNTDDRAIVRAMAQIVCCDIHPLNNLRVLDALRGDLSATDSQTKAWIASWIHAGFAALEQMIERYGGRFAFGDTPTLADCCLVPQVYSARRFDVPLEAYPNIVTISNHCSMLDEFENAQPEVQADCVAGPK